MFAWRKCLNGSNISALTEATNDWNNPQNHFACPLLFPAQCMWHDTLKIWQREVWCFCQGSTLLYGKSQGRGFYPEIRLVCQWKNLFLAKRTSRSGLQIKPDVVVPSWIATRDTEWTLQNYTTVEIERWPLAQHFTIFLNNLWAWHGNQIVSARSQ